MLLHDWEVSSSEACWTRPDMIANNLIRKINQAALVQSMQMSADYKSLESSFC